MKTIIFVLCLIVVHTHAAGQTKLAQYAVETTHVTMSGFSSGGTFAQMMQFCYSSRIQGVAVFSHNFYRCGRPNGDVDDYDRSCTKLLDDKPGEHYNPELVHKDIEEYLKKDLIEDPANLKDKRLYVYTGIRSFIFTPAQALGILNVYERYIKNPDHIKTRVQDSDLAMPSDNPKLTKCSDGKDRNSTFVQNCGFSGAFDGLNFLLPSKITEYPQTGGRMNLQPLVTFDQTEFSYGIAKHHMDDIGYLYVPRNCRNAVRGRCCCLLHFFFHGCLTGNEFVGPKHIQLSGYLELAELNNIIMVFPQAKATLPENESGCWDTFGVSGPLYATKQGAQIRIVKKMLDRILGTRA